MQGPAFVAVEASHAATHRQCISGYGVKASLEETIRSCAPLRRCYLALQDLISEVTCKEPYEWKDSTEEEWEFSPVVMSGNGAEPFKVSPKFFHYPSLGPMALQRVV